MSQLHLAAVVLNWKDNLQTLSCLEKLQGTQQIDSFFVVDNESDGSLGASLRDQISIEVIGLEENRGFSSGVNQGLERALERGATHVLVINNDAEIERKALESLLAEFDADNELGITGPVVLNQDGTIQSAGGTLNVFARTAHKTSPEGRLDYVTWACAIVSSKLIRSIGLLDTRFFMYYEDVDFSLRAREAGFRIKVCSNAMAVHEMNRSHGRAGGIIETYSTAALVAFGLKWRKKYPIVFTILRLFLRVVRQIFRGVSPRNVIDGAVSGWTCKGEAFLDMHNIRKNNKFS